MMQERFKDDYEVLLKPEFPFPIYHVSTRLLCVCSQTMKMLTTLADK